MSSLDLDLRSAASPATDIWRGLTAFSAALLALMLLWAAAGEPRAVGGVAVWMKPAKFALSFVVLFGTIALVADRLSPGVRHGWTMRILGLGMGIAMIAEMGWMIRQASRGAASHFNFGTPLEAFMYQTVMGSGAVFLVLSIGIIGWIAWRDRGADLGPALREGVWLGFLLSFVLTLVVAGAMSTGTGPHVGVHPEGAPTLPLFGWSGVAGDLRPAHFAALHAMQALPLLGLWLDGRGAARSVRTVRLAAIGWTALTAGLFAQGLLGMPLIRLG